jgi:hypothetical protein
MPTFYHGGIYIGLVALHDQEEDRVWTELSWSPDTKKWHRVLPGTPLIPNSDVEGEYDWGCVYPAAYPVFLEDGIRLYYGASDGLHTSWRNGFLGMATLRPDGFAGYKQATTDEPALITTTPLVHRRASLRLSADIEPGGYVLARVLSEDGETLAQSVPLKRTASDAEVEWHDDSRLADIGGATASLQFEFRGATIYSFGLVVTDESP